MTYHIGQTVPFDYSRGVWLADRIAPQWFIFHVKSQHELPAEAWLIRNGAAEAWHPTEKRWRFTGGSRRRKVPYEAAVVPGYVFALLDRIPHWDVLFDRARGKLLHVVSRDGLPLPIGEHVIEAMTDVPQRLHERRLALAEARRIRVGDRATLDPGSALAWTVEVTAIEGPFARIVTPLLGGRESLVDAARLERMMG
jgi:hypothetical protein